MRTQRGKFAINAAHEGISGEDEERLVSTISMLYDVGADEALEIHKNYHVDRILSSLVMRARKSGMKNDSIAKKFVHLDFEWVAGQVAKGKLAEAAAVDLLYRQLSRIENNGVIDDRYIRFYG